MLAWTAAHIFALLIALWAVGTSVLQNAGNPLPLPAWQHERSTRDVIVMYIFSATDPEFLANLRFFIAEAVYGDELCDYVIVIQEGTADHGTEQAAHPPDLPELPNHAKYVHHTNECYDWGTYGWLLDSFHVDVRLYKYFFFINCSVRGPFLPAYARGAVHWTQPFIQRLQGDVKLVGPTISCEGSPLDGDVEGSWRMNPHVQSYAIATDRVGLQLLIEDGHIFQCYDSRWNTIYFSELGASAAILAAGYNIDCFMARFQDVDWRDESTWECNGRISPTEGEHVNDGLTLDPLEVMFVKVKSYTLMNGISSARKAAKYQQWLHPDIKATRDAGAAAVANGPAASTVAGSELLVTSNEYLSDMPRFKLPRVLEAKARGPSCFDFGYYLEHNEDLQGAKAASTNALWKHYVYFGQFESRPSRFTWPV